MSATAAIRSQKWRTFFGSSSTIAEMLISTSAKARRRAASDGSHEVTTDSAHHASVASRAGRDQKLQASRFVIGGPCGERQEHRRKADLVDQVAAVGDFRRRLGEALKRVERNPDGEKHRNEQDAADQNIEVDGRCRPTADPM